MASAQLDRSALDALRGSVRGAVLSPGDVDYDDARALYNAMIDKRPAVIVRCNDVADVMAAVTFGREQELDIAIRGGGHNGGGLGSVDDGLVIDLSGMRNVRVDPDARTAVAGGGALLGDVDHATHAFGLATPGGIISTTGLGGLGLGGGVGHLTRKCGLTIDNFLEVDMVLADGTFVTANAHEHPDLFWAVRGGGGNFGVVTSFTLQLHEVSNVWAGPMLWPLDRTEDVLRFFHEFIGTAPEDLNGFFAFLTVPPAPPFPEELHLKKMCGIMWCYTGPADEVDAQLAPARALGGVALDGVMELPFPVWNSAFDALYPKGYQWYWRADYVRDIPEEAVKRNAEFGAELPTMLSGMHIYPVDGAAARVPNDATPWAYRDARYAQVMVGVDPDPANAQAITRWTVDYFDALHPYSMGGAYVNFMMDEGQERVRATYRENYDRLSRIKATYDPTNLFHVNQNIEPSI
jgi:FAD binding domain/Berberine and berberine like